MMVTKWGWERVLWEEIQRETAKIKRDLRGSIETYMYLGENDPNEITKQWGDRILVGHLLPPNKDSSTRIGLHLTEFLVKEAPWESPSKSGCCHNYRLFSRN